jgi:hypothetical protein
MDVQVFVDVSLLTPTSAVGRVSGYLESPAIPTVGQLVPLRRAVDANAGFPGELAVTNVLVASHDTGPEALVVLADIVVSTEDAGTSVGRALEHQYGLFFDPYHG